MELSSADIRHFMTEKFGDEDLDVFCSDQFRQVYNQFSNGMSKGRKIQLLFDYCEHQGKWSVLLAGVRDARSAQFDEWFSTNRHTVGANSGHLHETHVAMEAGEYEVASERTLLHDRSIYQKLEENLTESGLDELLSTIASEARCSPPQLDFIIKVITFSEQVSNEFIDTHLQDHFNIFIDSLKKLRDKLAEQFFRVYCSDNLEDYIYKLQPEMKIAYGTPYREYWDKQYEQVCELVKTTDMAYKQFRRSIKKTLFV
jgi:hypothetical protein